MTVAAEDGEGLQPASWVRLRRGARSRSGNSPNEVASAAPAAVPRRSTRLPQPVGRPRSGTTHADRSQHPSLVIPREADLPAEELTDDHDRGHGGVAADRQTLAVRSHGRPHLARHPVGGAQPELRGVVQLVELAESSIVDPGVRATPICVADTPMSAASSSAAGKMAKP